MHDELLELKNLGKTSAQWLHASGIHSASKVLLYAIEGALMDVNWNDLPPAHKAELNGLLDAQPTHNKR